MTNAGACRARMVAARAEAERRVAALDRTFDELVAAADLEPPDDEHDPDGTTAYERAQVTSLAAAARASVRALDRELARVEDQAYGGCATCGVPIGLARLEALPGTTTCVRCPPTG